MSSKSQVQEAIERINSQSRQQQLQQTQDLQKTQQQTHMGAGEGKEQRQHQQRHHKGKDPQRTSAHIDLAQIEATLEAIDGPAITASRRDKSSSLEASPQHRKQTQKRSEDTTYTADDTKRKDNITLLDEYPVPTGISSPTRRKGGQKIPVVTTR